MAPGRVFLLLLFVFITQAVAEDVGSDPMTVLDGWKFQCAATTCLPFVDLYTRDISDCQMACLAQSECVAFRFYLSTSYCEFFTDISDQNENMMTDIDTNTIIVISETRFLPG
ncbi:unnamed protein product [Adineta steineri]|uniref:Apple domain-containing protein n=1 Tax=Adineta steineri TaxID=433720 RepID=A0A815QY23_9BILA|nr:unnamed protein product [Adineta steineri]